MLQCALVQAPGQVQQGSGEGSGRRWFRRRSGKLWCRARSGSTGSREGLGGGSGSGLCLGGFGAGFQLWCRARSGSTGEGLGGFGAARSGSTEQGGLDLSPSFLCGGRTNAMLAIAILRDHRRRFPEKVREALVQSQQVQQGSGEGSGEGLGGFGAEPG